MDLCNSCHYPYIMCLVGWRDANLKHGSCWETAAEITITHNVNRMTIWATLFTVKKHGTLQRVITTARQLADRLLIGFHSAEISFYMELLIKRLRGGLQVDWSRLLFLKKVWKRLSDRERQQMAPHTLPYLRPLKGNTDLFGDYWRHWWIYCESQTCSAPFAAFLLGEPLILFSTVRASMVFFDLAFDLVLQVLHFCYSEKDKNHAWETHMLYVNEDSARGHITLFLSCG